MLKLFLTLPWYGLILFGWALAMVYLCMGIAVMIWMSKRFRWFDARMDEVKSIFIAALLTFLWPLTVAGFTASHWFRLSRYGHDRYLDAQAA